MTKYNHFARSQYDVKTKKLDKFDKLNYCSGCINAFRASACVAIIVISPMKRAKF